MKMTSTLYGNKKKNTTKCFQFGFDNLKNTNRVKMLVKIKEVIVNRNTKLKLYSPIKVL